MKKIAAFSILFCFIISSSNAQRKSTAPLVIQGKITNCPEKILKIAFTDENDKQVLDTIRLNEAGEFYLKTFKITKPQRTSLQQNRIQLNGLFVAPGYDLTITGDGTDFTSLFRTKQITGIGAATNQYRIKLDSVYILHKDTTQWYQLKLEPLLSYIKRQRTLQDSVMKLVFDRQPKNDPYFNFFKKAIQVDNESIALYNLLEHIAMNKYSYEQITTLVQQNMPQSFVTGISNDSYLASEDYKTWLLGTYIDYTKLLDRLKDSTLSKQPGYALHKIEEAFNGKVKEYYLYKAIVSNISASNSIERLNAAKKRLESYYDALKNEAYKKDLTAFFEEKEKQLVLLQIGKPAPSFTLPDTTGKTYTLASLKGKVVYIDLWASWCVPCRAEIPDFKKLYNKYKNNDQVVFLGIGVSDGEKEWKKALAQDQPSWLQLYDKEGVVAKTYVATAIPKYILIDKNGKVVNFDAPRPSNAAAIEKLLDEAIGKSVL